MSRAEELRALMEACKSSGIVLFDDVEKILPPKHNGGPELEDTLLAIEAAGLEILDETKAAFETSVAMDPDPQGDLEEPIKIYLRQMDRFAPLTRVREFELMEMMRTGEASDAGRALQELVQANILLPVAIAKRYGRGVKLLELVAAGNDGLLDAMRAFDCHKGYRFSSFAIWWVRQAVIRASRIH